MTDSPKSRDKEYSKGDTTITTSSEFVPQRCDCGAPLPKYEEFDKAICMKREHRCKCGQVYITDENWRRSREGNAWVKTPPPPKMANGMKPQNNRIISGKTRIAMKQKAKDEEEEEDA